MFLLNTDLHYSSENPNRIAKEEWLAQNSAMTPTFTEQELADIYDNIATTPIQFQSLAHANEEAKCGKLKVKIGDGLLSFWRERWCFLNTQKALRIYSDRYQTDLIASIQLQNVLFAPFIQGNNTFMITSYDSNKTYYFQSTSDVEEWISTIGEMLAS